MLVSDDAYELPLIIASTAQELADKAGTTANNVRSCASKYASGKLLHSRYQRIVFDDKG